MEIKKLAIFGATSAIAFETAKIFANKRTEILLLGRNLNKLETYKQDLIARSQAKVHIMEFNADKLDTHKAVFDEAINRLEKIDAVLIAQGVLPEQIQIENNVDKILDSYKVNALSMITVSTLAAEYFASRKKGTLAVISSVAGDRGRASNYIYGSAKAAVSSYLQGLRNRFGDTDINIITVKPGPVDTPMTEDMKKGLLTATAANVGKGIYNAMHSGKEVVYLPGIWRLIMLAVKSIPEKLFKKIKM